MTKIRKNGLTPHNEAQKGEIAKVVLMPGDPLRAKFIAETFLTDVKEVNNVRGMLAFTGEYKGKEITVMGSGMGIPSMGIYSYELFKFYDVDFIMRIGSAAGLKKEIDVFDILIADETYSESQYYKSMTGEDKDTLFADKDTLELVRNVADKNDIKINFGKVHSSDNFYKNADRVTPYFDWLAENDFAGVEMESFALHTNAIVNNKKALTILTISDHALSEKEASADQRETAFKDMMKLSLEVAVNYLGEENEK